MTYTVVSTVTFWVRVQVVVGPPYKQDDVSQAAIDSNK